MPYDIYVQNLLQTTASVSEGDTVRFWIRRTDASTSETLLFSTRQGTASYGEGDYETTDGAEPLDIPVFFGAGTFVRSIDIAINQDTSESLGQSEAFGALLYAANGSTQLASLPNTAVSIVDVPPPLPNLTIADVDVGSQDISDGELVTTPYSAGDNFSVTVDVENDGVGDASSSVLGLYLVRNGTAQLVDTNPTGSLSAGSTNTNETLSFALPSDLSAGQYELLIKTDYNDSVDESDIGDNIQSFFIDVVANQPSTVTIEAASSYAAGTVLNGTDLISVTDPDGSSDIQNILVYDAINSPGAVWRFNGTIIDPGGAGSQFELNYDNLNLLTYTVGTGSDTFSFEARDFSGNISNEASHTITAVVNDPPSVTIEAASSYAEGTVLNGSDLISVTDPDGSSDIQNILVYDAINSPGAVWRFNGTVIDPGGAGNQYELNYDNLNLLTYTVGTGSDTFSFEARDFSGNISNEASHTIAATTTETTYSLSPSIETIEEGDRTITFTVTRAGSNLIAETLYYSTLFGSASAANGDYDGAVDQELPFAANEAEASFTISINEDVKDENDETFRVMIATQENASSSSAEAIATVTILDDDTVSTSTDYPTIQTVDTSVANPLDNISYGVNSYLTSSLDPFYISLEEQGEVTTRVTSADDPDYEESVYWGVVSAGDPFEITFPGNHGNSTYSVILEVNNGSGTAVDQAIEYIGQYDNAVDLILQIGEIADAINTYNIKNDSAQIQNFMLGVNANFNPKSLGILGLVFSIGSIVDRVVDAEPQDRGALLFAETVNLVLKTAAIATAAQVGGIAGASASLALGPAAPVGFIGLVGIGALTASVSAGVVWDTVVEDALIDALMQGFNAGGDVAANLVDIVDVAYNFDETAFDPDYYAAAYPEAEQAVSTGQVSSLFAYYLSVGIDAGHSPNASGQTINRSDLPDGFSNVEPLTFGVPAFDAESITGDALTAAELQFANSTAPTIVPEPQSLSVQANSLASLSQASSAPAAAQVSAELSAAANRIAQDWILNNSSEAFARQDRSNPDGWAEIVSTGDDFRTALAGIAWPELQLDSSVRMIALLTSETDPELVYQQFIASAEGAAFLSDPSIESIGVGEYGGLWVIVVDDVAYANNAVVSTEVLNNRQFGTNNADVIFAGASASQVSLFDGSDSFVGGAHKDIVRPGLGNDFLTLGSGLDVVIGTLAELDGITITDFEPGDIIVLEGDYANPISRTYDNATGIFTLDPFGDGSATAQIQLPAGLGVSSLLEGSNFAGEGYGFEAEGASGRPDASFSGYSSGTPNTELLRGEDFSTYFEVTNTVFGDTSFGQQVSAKIVFSRDYIVSQDDIFLGDFTVEDLAIGEKNTFTNATVTLPDEMGTGEYYVGVVLDPDNDLTEAYEINNVAWYTHTFLVSAPPSPPSDGIAETGTVTLNHTATTLTLQRTYENPVVIAYVATENGAQPVNVRVSDVSGNDLTLQLQEPNYLDGSHVNETVNYLVVEAGTWILPDGTLLEAGNLNSNKLSSEGFETVTFDAEFDTAPVILSQAQTMNGSDFVTTRQRDADADGFRLTMQEEEANNSGRHNTESLGWVAIEAGSGTTGGLNWLAGSASGVTDATASVDLGASVSGGANVIAALSSFAGSDSAWARGDSSTDTTFDVSVEEETSANIETRHNAETVDYFAFNSSAVVSAYDYDLFA